MTIPAFIIFKLQDMAKIIIVVNHNRSKLLSDIEQKNGIMYPIIRYIHNHITI